MSDEEILVHNDFLEYFSSYISFGVEVIYTNNSLTFNYNDKSKKYVDQLLNKLYDEKNIIIIFRCRGNNISFTANNLKHKELFKKVKDIMDDIKFVTTPVEIKNSELISLMALYDKCSSKKIILTIGVTNKDNDKLFKLISTNHGVQECFKQVGLVVKENTVYFKKSKFNSLETVFNNIKDNPLVYYYQPNNFVNNGFVGTLYIGFLLFIDIISIVLGIYLLTR